MIDELLNQAAVAVLNRMLAREAWAREKLAPFAGRSARFDAVPFAVQVAVADGQRVAHAGRAPFPVCQAAAVSLRKMSSSEVWSPWPSAWPRPITSPRGVDRTSYNPRLREER